MATIDPRLEAELNISLKAAQQYTAEQETLLLKSLEQAATQVRSELLRVAEMKSVTPGSVLWKRRLDSILNRIESVLKELKKSTSSLARPMTKDAFRLGIERGVFELRDSGVMGLKEIEAWQTIIDGAFDVIDGRALENLALYNIKLLGTVSDRLLDDIKINLQAGILSGRDIGQIALDIGDVIKPSEKDKFRFAGKKVFKTAQNRIEVITRTEIMRSYNQGRIHLYKDMKVEKVVWYTALDERVCPVCGPLNGQEFELDQAPQIPAHPQCRCTILAI
nr:hypothetical protein 1 [bacterium]